MARSRSRHGLFTLRGILFRVAAVVLSLLPILAVEATLCLANWQPPTELEDPYIGFDNLQPLFELDESGNHFQTADARLEYFVRDRFSAQKPDNEFRIFALGGSTVQGRPYSIETAFTSWLELSLRTAEPKRKWRVVNCGGVSYASYRLAPILEEILAYEPDLITLYTGHNEFLEERTYEAVRKTHALVASAHRVASKFRTYSLLRRTLIRAGRSKVQREILPGEVDARLDYKDGLKSFHRDDELRSRVVEHFRVNLRRMITQASSASVPIFLVNPVCNLRDCPPFKTEPGSDLEAKSQQTIAYMLEKAAPLINNSPHQALESLDIALKIDQRHAGVQFARARCFEHLKQTVKQKEALVAAKDDDVCPLRIIEPIREAIYEIARSTKTPVIDINAAFERRSPNGIVGDEWMRDHVHPTVNGHQLIADLLLEALIEQGMVDPKVDWKSERIPVYEHHVKSLNPAYFERGNQRLEGLRLWTQGRARKQATTLP